MYIIIKAKWQDHMGTSYSSLSFSTCVKFFHSKKGNINNKPGIRFLRGEQTVEQWGKKQRFETEVTTVVQATSHQHVGQYQRLMTSSVDEAGRNWNAHPRPVCQSRCQVRLLVYKVTQLPYSPEIQFIGIYPTEVKTYIGAKICWQMFTAAYFVIAKKLETTQKSRTRV